MKSHLHHYPFWRKLVYYAPALQFLVFLGTMIITFSVYFTDIRKHNFDRTHGKRSINNTLLNLDDKIYEQAINSEMNYLLSSLYFDISDDIDSKQKADIILKNVAGKPLSFKWETIPELYDSIMYLGRSFDETDIEAYRRLLSGIAHSDRMLFLIYRAHNYYYKFKVIDEQDWIDNYRMYLVDLAKSPLFLCSIYINFEEGYLNKKDENFLKEVKKALIEGDEEFIITSYPELLNGIDNIGT